MPSKRAAQGAASHEFRLPGYAQVLAELGPKTSEAISALIREGAGSTLFAPTGQLLRVLEEGLRTSWTDAEAASAISAIHECVAKQQELNPTTLARWLRAHRNDSRALTDCLQADPPDEITIIQLLSRAGSQKLVFLANWEIAQREVVLKRFIGPEAAERLIPRELQPHPLSMAHPNIIETHLLRNRKGEGFLVERRLPMVLNDSWSSHGVQEAANLLRDIASALAYLQEKQLVHGDIKPDNIGFEDGNYILLDFGICRPIGKFDADATPTGSLRTRAPEVLLGERNHSYSSDIWALGATVYNAVAGRFPLFSPGEAPPRVSTPAEREAFEGVLRGRVRQEWSSRVDPCVVPEPLRPLLQATLDRDPDNRTTAADLVKEAEEELAGFLRASEGPSRFSPEEELEQLVAYLPGERILSLMPDSQKHQLRRRLEGLRGAKGLTSGQREKIDSLQALVHS